MTDRTNRMSACSFILFALMLIIATFSVSNTMPLTLHAVMNGLNAMGYLLVMLISISALARMIYAMDKKTGRIRNKIRWFG